MSGINLSKNKGALESAFREVTNPESQSDWAVFGYDGRSFDLKVVATGEDGFEEMVDELNGGKIMYAVCRVKDPNTSLPKIVFVNWQGEGVPSNVKGVCANHLRDVSNFFKGCHVTINARSESDLDYDAVLEKVKKSSGANYSIHKEKQKPMEKIKPVGAVYKRVNPIEEINVKQRDSFWMKQEQEESKRLAQEKEKAEKERQEEDKKRKEREAQEEISRDHMIRERTKSIEQQRSAQKQLERKKMDDEKRRYQEMLKEKEKDDQEFRKRSDSERRQRIKEMQHLIGSRQTQKDPKSFESAEVRKEAPREVPHEVPHVVPREVPHEVPHEVPREVPREVPHEAPHEAPYEAPHEVPHEVHHEAQQEPQPSQIDDAIVEQTEQAHGVIRSDETEPQMGLAYSSEYQEREAPKDDSMEENTADFQEEYKDANESSHGHKELSSLCARAIYDYQAEGEDEISFDPGDIIQEIEKFDEGWWRGRATNGHFGLFPANYVELISDQVEDAQSPTEATQISAKALYDYQASDATEITFDPGDIITNIDKIDEGWWSGTGPDGSVGLFPANYVEEL